MKLVFFVANKFAEWFKLSDLKGKYLHVELCVMNRFRGFPCGGSFAQALKGKQFSL